MVKMYKTKKIKKQFKKKTKKIYRGGAPTADELNDKIKEKEIMDEVKNSSTLSSLIPNLQMPSIMGDLGKPLSKMKEGAINIATKGVTLAEGLAEKGIEKAGNVVGVDVTRPELIENKLRQMESIISNPVIKEEIGKIGVIAGESVTPYIKPLEDKVMKNVRDVGEELGSSAVKIGLNTAEEIPGVGIIIGTLRSIDQATKAGLSSINAASEVVKDTADTINASTKNFKRLFDEKMKIGDRINSSISNFTNPQNLLSKAKENAKSLNFKSPLKTQGGSNKKKYNSKLKKHTNKNKNKRKNKYK
jgi:hypothetical protein